MHSRAWVSCRLVFQIEIVSYLMNADFIRQTLMKPLHVWKLLSVVWFSGIYMWTDEGVLLRVCYVTLPWLSVTNKHHDRFPGGTDRLQIVAVSSGCDASLHPLHPDLHIKRSPGWSRSRQQLDQLWWSLLCSRFHKTEFSIDLKGGHADVCLSAALIPRGQLARLALQSGRVGSRGIDWGFS